MSVETRAVAERVILPAVGKVVPMVYRELVDAIDEALCARDERAAKIAEEMYVNRGWHNFYTNAGITIAAAIRSEADVSHGGNHGE